MKKYINKISILLVLIIVASSCTELDLVPLNNPTSAPFVSKQQFREGLNEGYRSFHYPVDETTNGIDDDLQRRNNIDRILAGTLTAEDGTVRTIWRNKYKGISRMISIKKQIENQNGILADTEAKRFLGEANFFLGYFWGYLVTRFGDVPFYEDILTVEQAFEISRTDKEEVLKKAYEYFDIAIANLPESYSTRQFATKGAALAMKARIALYMGDYDIAAKAAKACMDLNEYKLHPSYRDLFLSGTRTSDEYIFYIPRSLENKAVLGAFTVQDHVTRNNFGYGARNPTWALLASYECVDGLPIDESPMFDPRNPFKNRDPRLLETITPFGSLQDGDGRLSSDGTEFLGFEYTPHPDRRRCLNYETNQQVTNRDTRSNQSFASFNGLVWKKGIDKNWLSPYNEAENNLIVLRYADVLLMYAEAKIELNQIDNTVLKAINDVRDRAYANSNFANPRVTLTNQERLRYIVRNERRAEFAKEGLRYMDLIRWRLAKKALTGNTYGMLTVTPLRDNVVNQGLWFWGQTPQLDEDGIANFDTLVTAGLARTLAETNFPERQYLWPIPTQETLDNPNLLPNNPGY